MSIIDVVLYIAAAVAFIVAIVGWKTHQMIALGLLLYVLAALV